MTNTKPLVLHNVRLQSLTQSSLLSRLMCLQRGSKAIGFKCRPWIVDMIRLNHGSSSQAHTNEHLDNGLRNHSSTISLKILPTITSWDKSNFTRINSWSYINVKKKWLPSLLFLHCPCHQEVPKVSMQFMCLYRLPMQKQKTFEVKKTRIESPLL